MSWHLGRAKFITKEEKEKIFTDLVEARSISQAISQILKFKSMEKDSHTVELSRGDYEWIIENAERAEQLLNKVWQCYIN